MDLNCKNCGKLIKHGSPYVAIIKNVEYYKNYLKNKSEVISVLDSEELVSYCVDCGKLFNANILTNY